MPIVRSVLLLVLVAFTVAAQPLLSPASKKMERHWAPVIRRAEQLIADSMAVEKVPGIAIAVAIRDTLVWSKGFGFADLEQRVPVTPATRFRVASVSKSLTSAAVGSLVDEGKLNLDATVQTYVPSFPVKRWPITVRQVAGHIAGIRHYRNEGEMVSRKRYRSVAEALEIFENDSLNFRPGTRMGYSSYGWNLISAVLEGASHTRFFDLMHARVFEPLGMTHTVPDFSDSLILNRARWYTTDSLGTVINAPFADNSNKWAGGGFLSTTEDLLRFCNGMMDHRVVSRQTTEMMWTSMVINDTTKTRYGIGWFVETDKAGRRLIAHTGGAIGGTSYIMILPDQHIALALLVNNDGRFIRHAQAILAMFADALTPPSRAQ